MFASSLVCDIDIKAAVMTKTFCTTVMEFVMFIFVFQLLALKLIHLKKCDKTAVNNEIEKLQIPIFHRMFQLAN